MQHGSAPRWSARRAPPSHPWPAINSATPNDGDGDDDEGGGVSRATAIAGYYLLPPPPPPLLAIPTSRVRLYTRCTRRCPHIAFRRRAGQLSFHLCAVTASVPQTCGSREGSDSFSGPAPSRECVRNAFGLDRGRTESGIRGGRSTVVQGSLE